MHCRAFYGLRATGFASAPRLQKALAEPVAHINIRLTEHYRPVDLVIQVGCVQRQRNTPVSHVFPKRCVALRFTHPTINQHPDCRR